MATTPPAARDDLRFAADEPPPHPASFVIGLQAAILVCVPIVVVTTIVARVANQSDAYLSWAIFAGMVTGGLTTIVQSRRIGRLGAGNLIVMGTSGASIGVAVLALHEGGPALLGTLVVASGLCQLGFAARLVLLRRLITPLVSGTLLALVSVTVMPMGFAMLVRLPEDVHSAAGPVIAAVTTATVVALMLRAPRRLRAWTPILGMGTGCAAAALFGVLDFSRLGAASWFGVPSVATPGLDLAFDSRFWILLPGFLFVTFVITVRQVGDAVRMQRLSRREPRAIDFRRVEGSVAACGSGTLLAGLAGIPAPWPYAAGIALADGIGIAARRVGVYIGAIFVALAFVPKITALVLSIPSPVLGAYIVVIFGLAGAQGMRVVFREGPERRNALVAGALVLDRGGHPVPGHLPQPPRHTRGPHARKRPHGRRALCSAPQPVHPVHRPPPAPDGDAPERGPAARARPLHGGLRLEALLADARDRAPPGRVRGVAPEPSSPRGGRACSRSGGTPPACRGPEPPRGRAAGIHRRHPGRQPGEPDGGPSRFTRPRARTGPFARPPAPSCLVG